MPRYFFHVTYETTQRDLDGIELADDRAAHKQAIEACTEILKDLGAGIRFGIPWSMEVVEEKRGTICLLRFQAEIMGDAGGGEAPAPTISDSASR